MFYALNKDGIRIDAYEADKNEQYTCPICNNRVILKRGSVNIDHFAHEANVCEDTWNYDMSEWHKRMQNYLRRLNLRASFFLYNFDLYQSQYFVGSSHSGKCVAR